MTLSARIDVTTLRKAAALARKVAGRRGPALPTSRQILMTADQGRLVLYANNLVQAITVEAPAWDASGGPVAVHSPDLTRLLRGMPRGAATLTGDAESIVLESAPVKGAVRAANPDDMPTFSPVSGPSHTLDPDQLDTLDRVAMAASTDEARPVLTGVYLDGTSAAATDSYRLHTATVHNRRLADGALVPADTIRTVAKLARGRDVTYRVEQPDEEHTDRGRSSFVWSRDDLDVDLTVDHIEGKFPKWKELIPDPTLDERVGVDRAQLLDIARRHLAFCGGPGIWHRANAPVLLTPSGKGRTLVETTVDRMSLAETVDLDWPCVSAFNPAFLVDLLEAADGDTVDVQVRDGLKPIVARTGTVQLLLMPMRTEAHAARAAVASGAVA